MKRILFLTMLALAVGSVNAQGVAFGVKGGLNNTKLNTDLENVDLKSGYGWFVGPTLKVSVLPFFAIQGAALYSQNNAKVNDETIRQKSVLVPIDARLNLTLGGEAGLYVATGPQFGFNVGDDEFNWKESESINSTFQLKKSTFNWNFGAGVMVHKKLELGFNYSIGIAKTGELKHLTKDDKPTSKLWSVAATWFF